MPAQKISDAELLALADLCNGNQSEMSRRLGGYSQSTISHRLKRLSWAQPAARSVAGDELTDDEIIRRIQARLYA